MRIDALILAAGASSRLGQPKQLLRVGAQTLSARAVRTAAAAVNGTVHVVGGAVALGQLPERAQVHQFAQWRDGQHASLCFGLTRLADVDGVLVTPCDQYRVTIAQLRRLVAAFEQAPHRPAAAAYGATLGIPVVWPASWFDAVRAAPRGQSLLTPDACTVVALQEAAYDVDTPQDLAALRRSFDSPSEPARG